MKKRLPKNYRLFLITSTIITSMVGTNVFAQETVQTSHVQNDVNQEDTTDIDKSSLHTVIVRAERSLATAKAPSKAALDQGEPQSIISRPYIENSGVETDDFTGIASITPSAASSGSSNGPGFGESKVTLRGFKDGNYNVTFEGIPWGDTNNPTHHSNSFFPASTIGAIVVDRGPGAVGDFGQANYGGNIKMFSNKVDDKFGVTLRQTFGTWNSWQSVAVMQTGNIEPLHNLAGFVNFQMNGSDGALSYSSMHSTNFTTKWRLPINDDWNVSLFAMTNKNHWRNTDNPGGTEAQIAMYGKDFLLSNDPTKATYYGYNEYNKNTTFSYLREEGKLPFGFTLQNTSYNSYYDNKTDTAKSLASADGISNDPSTMGVYLTPGGKVDNSHIQGYNKLNHYMNWGDILRLDREFEIGTLHLSAWYESSKTNRHTYDYAADLGRNVWDYREKPVCIAYDPLQPNKCKTYSSDTSLAYKSYEEQSNWLQWQGAADFALKIGDKLTITPGVKYVWMKRKVTAAVIKSPRQAQYATDTNEKALGNLNINYKLKPNWSVYAEYAQGMYMPDISSLYVINPSANTAEPSLSTNYQLGTVFQNRHWSVDVDIYKIDLTNLLVASPDNQIYENFGKAKNQGIEGQVAYSVGDGVSVFINGSVNEYTNVLTGLTISGAPKSTLGMGFMYEKGPFNGSLIYKATGSQYMDNSETQPLDAYGTLDLSMNYKFGDNYRVKLQVNNIAGTQSLSSYKINTKNPLLTTYNYTTGRNIQLTFIAKY